MAKQSINEVVADVPVSTNTDEQDALTATSAALDAAERNPEYPGFQAVRDLYESNLKLARLYEAVMVQYELLRGELAQLRAKVGE